MIKHYCKSFLVVFIVCLSIMLLPVESQAAADSCAVKATVNYKESYKFLNQLNALRKSKGAQTVKMDKNLLKCAEQRAAELIVRYSHTRPNGKLPNSLSSKISAENIAYNYPDASSVYEGWFNSPGHYRNMIDPAMKSVGICCIEYGDGYYWVNVFGRQKAKAVKNKGTKKKSFKVAIDRKYLKAANISSYANMSLTVDEDMILDVTIRCTKNDDIGTLPAEGLSFKSDTPDILQVSKKGIVKAIGAGEGKITVSLKSNKKIKKTFKINVIEDDYVLQW